MKKTPIQSATHKKDLEDLRDELNKRKLINRRDVQGLLYSAYNCRSPRTQQSIMARLQLILDSYDKNARRQPDEFRPYGPESLLNKGKMHLMTQMDGVSFLIDPNKLVTGMLIIGPQGSGKSRLILHLVNELLRTKNGADVTIVDPKNGFNNLPGFKHLDLANISLDLKAPPNVTQNNFIYEFMPILADLASLIFGLDFLNQATDIAMAQLQQYKSRTNNNSELCLSDIYQALLLIKVTNFRKVGYHDSATTALSLTLGKSNLFKCRKGLSLDWLFTRNTVIDAHTLTSELQCKIFLIYLLYWLYQRARNLPETKEIKHLIIVDDATRFVGMAHQYDAQRRASQLGHLLAVLRSSGIAIIFATQLPAQVDPAVVSLSRNMIVVGNVNGDAHLNIVSDFMSLSPAQKNAIIRFQPRETLAFISGSSWRYPVHGWVPHVQDLSTTNIHTEDLSNMITPWYSLRELPKTDPSMVVTPLTPPKTLHTTELKTLSQDAPQPTTKTTVDTLVYDCITFPFDKAGVHAKRLPSIREYDVAKTDAVQEGYLIPASCGKSLYLIPSIRAYEKFSQPCPFKRITSLEHGFFVALTAHLLKKDPFLSKVQMETPLGTKGATIDVTTVTKAGEMTAYEVTLNTSNLLSNATKLQDSAYKKIVWLCRDAAIAKAVQAYFNKSKSLPDDLLSKFQYTHFSRFSKQYERKQ